MRYLSYIKLVVLNQQVLDSPSLLNYFITVFHHYHLIKMGDQHGEETVKEHSSTYQDDDNDQTDGQLKQRTGSLEKEQIDKSIDQSQQQSDENDQDEEESQQRYGWFCFQPDWLQVFNNRRWLAFLVGFTQLCYSFITAGYDSSIVSTLQKAFGLSSFDIGALAACFSISQSTFGVLIAHKGAQSHKGKWVGITIIMTGIGCFIYAMPHFLIGSYSILQSFDSNGNLTDVCTLEQAATLSNACSNGQTSGKSLHIAMFIIGLIIIGAGTSVMRTVGWSYLDESVSPTVSPIYTAFNLSMIGLGTAFGFVFGGVALNIYGHWPSEVPGKYHDHLFPLHNDRSIYNNTGKCILEI